MSPTGKSDSFRSCVRACVRASEAVCARERAFLHPLGRGNSRSSLALISDPEVFADRCWGFKRFECFLLTGAGVLRDANDYGCSRLGFYEMFVKTPAYSSKVESVVVKPQQITAK